MRPLMPLRHRQLPSVSGSLGLLRSRALQADLIFKSSKVSSSLKYGFGVRQPTTYIQAGKGSTQTRIPFPKNQYVNPSLICGSAAKVETPSTVSKSAQASETFSWSEQWYPVGFLVDLPTTEPIPFSLFDTKLVVWCVFATSCAPKDLYTTMFTETPSPKRNETQQNELIHPSPTPAICIHCSRRCLGNGRWACMADECPHRRAPLSRGRLFRAGDCSSGSGGAGGPTFRLECAYHGWQFDGEGTCIRLPQLLPPGYTTSLVAVATEAEAGGNAPTTTSSGPGAVAEPVATAAAVAFEVGKRSSSSSSSGSSSGTSGRADGLQTLQAAGRRQRPGAPVARVPPTCSGQAFPTAVAQGMVWVWYGSVGGGSHPDESLIPLDFAERGRLKGEDWALVDVFTRDFPYDWETMVENVVDPSHVAFAHDGTGQGLDRHASPPLELQLTQSGPGGFSGRFRGVRSLPARSREATATFQPGAWSELEFQAPCLVSMRFTLPGKGQAGLVLYCVPLGKGRSRMIARLPRNFATGWLAGLQPRWAKHLPRMAVLDQDIDLLREQEVAMTRARLAAMQQSAAMKAPEVVAAVRAGAAAGGDVGGYPTEDATTAVTPIGGVGAGEAASAPGIAGDWRNLYVMLSPADRFVVQFRRWLDKTGGSQPWAIPAARSCGTAAAAAAAAFTIPLTFGGVASDDPLPRERVLDRYNSHVRSCSACSGALTNFERLTAGARLIGMVVLAAAAGIFATSSAATATATALADKGVAATVTVRSVAAAAAWQLMAAGLALAAAAFGLLAAWSSRMVTRFRYTEEGRHLRMNENRWLRRLLFSGTNSFNSMVALTSKKH